MRLSEEGEERRCGRAVPSWRFACLGNLNLAATSSMVWVDGELHSARVAMWRVNRGETFGVCQTYNFGESFLYCNLISFSAMPWWKRS